MEKTMRVAMIIHGYAPRVGGAERQLGALAPELQSLGVEVCVITRRLPGTPSFEKIDGVSVYRLPAAGPKIVASLTFTLSALPLLVKLRPDLIHAHELISPATIGLMGHYLLRRPLVLTPHLSGPTGDVLRMRRKMIGGLRLKLFCREASAFVTISAEIDTELEGSGVPHQRRVAIANGVDSRRFSKLSPEDKNACRQRLGLPLTAPIAVFVGRLVPVKRPNTLLKIWPEIRKICPDALLLLLGSGPLEDELKQAAPEGVKFCGSQEDVAPYLQAADLFVLPSISEGLPVSLLEGMACELPCLVTRVGGNPDVIDHGVNGWLVPPDDPDSLQAAIQTLFGDPAMRERLGGMGRKRVLEKYTIENTANRLIQLYQKILSSQKEGGSGVFGALRAPKTPDRPHFLGRIQKILQNGKKP